MPRCLLIASSDTSDIDDCTEYPNEDAAKAAMVEAYNSFIEAYAPQVDDRFSGVRGDNAFAVTETESRFWKIYPLFIP